MTTGGPSVIDQQHGLVAQELRRDIKTVVARLAVVVTRDVGLQQRPVSVSRRPHERIYDLYERMCGPPTRAWDCCDDREAIDADRVCQACFVAVEPSPEDCGEADLGKPSCVGSRALVHGELSRKLLVLHGEGHKAHRAGSRRQALSIGIAPPT
jgi:hypothetical protein